MSASPSPIACTVRTASVVDVPAVRAIDNACFPPGDRDREPAPPGELEDACLVGDVRLLEIEGRPVAYLHADRTTRPERIYISGLGVSPDRQRLGLGSRLIDDCLRDVDDGTRASMPIVTITSPRNLIMLRIICGRGFRGRRILRSYFGPGRDRLGCELTATGWVAPAAELLAVPAWDLAALYRAIDGGAHVVQGIGPGPDGAIGYLLAPARAEDFPVAQKFEW